MMEKEKISLILKKEKIFPEEIQKKIGRDRAVVYSVHLLKENEIEPTFQRICVTSQKLFPESFSFTEFKEYPDSRIVRNCLWHCVDKSKGWLIGSDKTSYSLTKKGMEEITEVFDKLKKDMDIKNLPLKLRMNKVEKVTKPTDKEINYLREIEKSHAYMYFMNNGIDKISLFKIKKSLGGDRYSPTSYFEEKIKDLLEMAKKNGEKKIEKYLQWVNEGWGKLAR